MTTVGELILALATYPLESEVTTGDPFVTLDVERNAHIIGKVERFT